MPVATRSKGHRNEFKWTDEHLSDFLDTTTIAGVFHVFRDRSRIRRIIWAVVFILAIIACLILIALSIASFASRPTASTLLVNSFHENGLSFPAVTVCNLNVRGGNLSVSDELYKLVNYLFNSDEEFLLHSLGYNSTHSLNECRRIIDEATDFEKALQLWRLLSTDNLIHYCGFHAGADSEVISCRDDWKPVLTTAGICYTYNGIQSGKEAQIVTTTGKKYGLKLILNIDQETHPSLDGIAGVDVIIHERDDIARPNLYGISVPPGKNVNIGVRKAINIDKTSLSNCIESRPLELLPDFRYSQFACRENALLEHIAEENVCGCLLRIRHDRPTSGPYVNTPNCTFNDICCLVNEFETFDQYNNCPLPCNFEFYHFEDSYSSFPNGPFLNELANSLNTTTESVRDNFLSVHIFVEDLQVVTSIIQYTYSAVSLFADIGGQLGLFLGISIISISEVIILIFDEVKKLLITKTCQKKIHNMEMSLPTFDIISVESPVDDKVSQNSQSSQEESTTKDDNGESTIEKETTLNDNNYSKIEVETIEKEEDNDSKVEKVVSTTDINHSFNTGDNSTVTLDT